MATVWHAKDAVIVSTRIHKRDSERLCLGIEKYRNRLFVPFAGS